MRSEWDPCPIWWGALDHGLGDEPGIQLHHAVPARLIEQLRAGEIDVAMVSSIELFRTPGYRYIGRHVAAGESYVGSVQVFSGGRSRRCSIAMDPSGHARPRPLTRTLLQDRKGARHATRRSPWARTPGRGRIRTRGSASVTPPCGRR